MQVTIKGAERVQARLDSGLGKMAIVLQRRINTASAELQGAIVRGLAAGTYGIFSRHGMSGLAGSVRVNPAESDGNVVRGGVQGAGGAAFYGVYHEEGGEGPYTIVPVNKKALAWLAYGTPAKLARKQRSFGFTKDEIVVARVTHPTIKRRRWMGGAVDDMRSRIREIVGGSAQEAFGIGSTEFTTTIGSFGELG